MPPAMSGLADSLVAGRPRNTNFSIAAIMSGPAVKQEEEDEDLDVGNEEVDAGIVEPEEKIIKKEKRSKVSGKSNCDALNGVKCTLDNKELWDKFCEFGTEMIITRTGRRMFPTVRCSFANLDMEAAGPGTRYIVLLDIVPCDNKRYRYAYHRSSWLVAGKADPPPPHRLYCHPDAPFTGEQLRKQVVSFEKVKVTNNESDNTGQVILNSMHKFQPRIYLVMRAAGENGPVTDIEKEKYRTFVFPETQFTAVTAYQNQLITKLKIESNPFAKGFRDSSTMCDSDDPFPSPFGPPCSLPGGLPGLDPFIHMRSPMMEDNNNLMMAAEKARLMMMQRAGPLLPPGFPPQGLPGLPLGLSPDLLARYSSMPPDLLARYSAMQAGLGLYNPALLAAALKSSPPTSSAPTSLLASSLALSPKSPTEPSPPNPFKAQRFSPYIIPTSRPAESPSRFSTASDGETRSPSPRSSPPALATTRPPSLSTDDVQGKAKQLKTNQPIPQVNHKLRVFS